MNTEILDHFKGLDFDLKKQLSRITSPLILGSFVLDSASTKFGVELLDEDEICEAIEQLGIASKPISIRNAFSKAGDKIIKKRICDRVFYKLSTRGKIGLQNKINLDYPQIYYLEKGKPYSNRQKLDLLLKQLVGDILICDPYFGEKSILSCSQLLNSKTIKFLTCPILKNVVNLKNLCNDFKKEKPSFDIRIFINPLELHDRYIISDGKTIIIGHGIKDIGTRESFLFVLENNYYKDFSTGLKYIFIQRWNISSSFI
jgi:hypothetical protein